MQSIAALYVSDTVLYVRQKAERCYCHAKTKEKPRLSDGMRHPVKIVKGKEKSNA